MKAIVEFRSTAFPPYEDEEEEINPGRWGKRLAEFLKIQFRDHGILTGDICFDDWGVALPLLGQEFSTLIGCGNSEQSDDSYLCFVSMTPSLSQKLFGKGNTRNSLAAMKAKLDQILSESPEISDILWSEANLIEGLWMIYASTPILPTVALPGKHALRYHVLVKN